MLFLALDPILIPATFMALMSVFAGSLLWYKHKAALARTRDMENLATRLQMSFSAVDSFGLSRQLQGFELFKRERTRWIGKGKVSNVMRGQVEETEVYLFDYSYTVQAGNSRKRITQTVFFANDKHWALPDFHLKPEKWWHKLQTKFGMNADINFQENPEFSDKFWLKGTFEELIRQKFTPSLQGFLSEKPPAHLEGNNFYLIGYKPRKKLNADEAALFFQHCMEVVKHLQESGQPELLNLAELRKERVMVETQLKTG